MAEPSHEPVAGANAEASHRTKGLLRLTMACNERCPFCNVPMEAYPRPTAPEAEVLAELDAFVASGEQTLTISGGEPTLLRRRLVRVVAEARARGVRYVELQTNAILIDAGYAAELAAAGATSAFVSLLSDVPELHDQLAGLDGAHPRCLAGIDALLDAGIRVTLNPVTAAMTQARLPDYVDFVSRRLPRVRSISVSAVQPHGRAASDRSLELLLPDYAVLGPAVREARRRAEAAGIELVNPYCGLPLCVGWADGLDRSVEAVEAERGGWRSTPGIENLGDKRHGEPCRGCAVRTRCGGAWHAYWQVRGGSGLRAPIALVSPWAGDGEGQAVIRAAGGPTDATWAALAAADAFTVWLWTDRLAAGDDERLLASGSTDLALEADPSIVADRATLRVLRRLATRPSPPQLRRRVWIGLRGEPAAVVRAVEVLVAIGVDGVRWLDGSERVAERLRAHHRADVRVEAARRRL